MSRAPASSRSPTRAPCSSSSADIKGYKEVSAAGAVRALMGRDFPKGERLMRVPAIIGAALLAASTALYAQAPKSDGKAGEGKAARQEAREKVRKACEGKDGDARRDCMRKELCAQSKDPANCEAQAKEWMAKRDKAREACK